MDLQRFRVPEIDEATLQDAAPAVRAEVVRRLEHIWQSVAPLMESTPPSEEDPFGRRADPRFVEAGIRVLDRLIRLYRLDHPGVVAPQDPGEDALASSVEQMLRELEARLSE